MSLAAASPPFLELRAWLYRSYWQTRSARRDLDLSQACQLVQQSQRWPERRLRELRDRKLRDLVARMHAVSPLYRRMMGEGGVTPADIRGLADIARLPIMTKAILRQHAAELRATDLSEEQLETGATGGTTGVPMKVVRDLAGTPWMRAAYWRGFGWGGLRMGEPWAQLFGGSLGQQAVRPHNRLKNWFAGKVFLPAFELDERNVGAYVEAINRGGARFLVGYASACNQLASLVERAGLELRLEAVFPTAELLLEEWEERMRRVFGATILPYYGCGEVQSLGYSCPEAHGVYHTSDEHVVLEVEGATGQGAFEGEGAFLITDLDNHAMPLIRYRNGDAGKLAGPGCTCGRSLGRILRLDGRVQDVLLTTTGNAISGALGPHAFRLIQNVDAFQIVQRRPGHAAIRIVRGPEYDPATEEPKLRAIFSGHLGPGSEIEIEYPPDLPKTAAGKSRLVMNEYLARAA
ncbi:MAG TPA: hypothetical protein VMT03_03460 [Polyangia bacterium]|nr:hypothetical protein [Polyangia bacterium]